LTNNHRGQARDHTRKTPEATMKDCTRASCLALVLLLAWCGVSRAAEVKTVVVSAESTVSFDDAVQQALRTAVRQVAGVVLTGETKVKDFELIRDAIYSRAAGYCRSYDVLDKSRTLEETYAVRVRADVATGKIQDDALAILSLIEQMGRPTFATAIDERTGAEHGTKVWVEGAINDHFEGTGFSMLHSKTRDEAALREMLRAAQAGDTAKARQLGLRMGSPYGVVVTAFAQKKAETVYGVPANSAVVELQVTVVHRDSGEVLASRSVAGKAASIDTTGMRLAANRAVAEVFPEVLERILYHWSKDIDTGAAFTVEIAQAPFDIIDAARKVLESLDGVTHVSIVEAPEGGVAVLRVLGRVPASALAVRLSDEGQGRFRVGVSGRTVTATYTPDTSAGREGGAADAPEGASSGAGNPTAPGHDGLLPAAIIGAAVLLAAIAAAWILKRS
jgi:hypothetical protein